MKKILIVLTTVFVLTTVTAIPVLAKKPSGKPFNEIWDAIEDIQEELDELGGQIGSIEWADILNMPPDIADGDDDTQLTEAEVDAYVANNGYLTSLPVTQYYMIPACTFQPSGFRGIYYHSNGYGLWAANSSGKELQYCAPVILPHEATITELWTRLYVADTADNTDIDVILYKGITDALGTGSAEVIAEISSSGDSSVWTEYSTTSISSPMVNSMDCSYWVAVTFSPLDDTHMINSVRITYSMSP